ncbi:MAG TPA: DUF6789 family protein, partial [Candidatus Limnocylindria bacterium]|nr:DUF6789 family protein [Candidatus Limnocylindria bacterium]
FMEQQRTSLLRSVANGLGAGLGATMIMSLVMVAGERLGLLGQHPPSKLSDRLLDRVTPFRSREETDAVGTMIHLGIGAGLGAAFALLRRLVPLFRIPGAGVAYALGVWATSYAGLLPALKIMPMPGNDRPGRPPVMIAAHVVFGLALGLLTRRSARRLAR